MTATSGFGVSLMLAYGYTATHGLSFVQRGVASNKVDVAISDIVLFGVLIYVAVMSLVRLMDARRREVLAELNEEVRQAKIEQLQSNMRQITADKANQPQPQKQRKPA